jgi:hypothetical protein
MHVFFGETLYTQHWIDNELSNFEYLMILNEYSGRSSHDVGIYPIFPWVISDYSSPDFAKVTYRDLNLPMTAQQENANGLGDGNAEFYMSASPPGLVSSYLSRIDPFCALPALGFPPFKSLAETFHRIMSCENTSEITPEFFFAPEYFAGDLVLPPWAKNDPAEFVYLHRKALESDQVTKGLARWIDLIFGCATAGDVGDQHRNVFTSILFKLPPSSNNAHMSQLLQKTGQMPSPLFFQPHPERRLISRAPTFSSPKSAALEHSQFLFAHIIESSRTSVVFLAVCSDGTLVQIRVDFAVASNRSSSVIGRIKPDDLICAGFDRGFAAIDTKRSLSFIVKSRGIVDKQLDHNGIRFLAGGPKSLTFANANGHVYNWDIAKTGNKTWICCIGNDYITCMDTNREFSIVAVGTRDGKVLVHSIQGGSFIFSHDISKVPERIVITHGWGFVLVEADKTLFLFSINGRLIRKTEIDFSIAHVVTWKCERGCDFFAIADTKGCIRICEAFYLNLDNVIFTAKSSVVLMSYILYSRALAVLTYQGEMILVPKELPSS